MDARTPNAARVARHYQRQKKGVVVIPLPVDAKMVAYLHKCELIEEHELDNREAIADGLRILHGLLVSHDWNINE